MSKSKSKTPGPQTFGYHPNSSLGQKLTHVGTPLDLPVNTKLWVPVGSLLANPANDRDPEDFSPKSMAGLVKSIRQGGVREAAQVTPILPRHRWLFGDISDADFDQIVATRLMMITGHRRAAGHEETGKRSLFPIMVVDHRGRGDNAEDTDEDDEWRTLVATNVDGRPLSPWAQAKTIRRWSARRMERTPAMAKGAIDESWSRLPKMTYKDVMPLLGLQPRQAKRILRLADFPNEVGALFREDAPIRCIDAAGQTLKSGHNPEVVAATIRQAAVGGGDAIIRALKALREPGGGDGKGDESGNGKGNGTDPKPIPDPVVKPSLQKELDRFTARTRADARDVLPNVQSISFCRFSAAELIRAMIMAQAKGKLDGDVWDYFVASRINLPHDMLEGLMTSVYPFLRGKAPEAAKGDSGNGKGDDKTKAPAKAKAAPKAKVAQGDSGNGKGKGDGKGDDKTKAPAETGGKLGEWDKVINPAGHSDKGKAGGAK